MQRGSKEEAREKGRKGGIKLIEIIIKNKLSSPYILLDTALQNQA